MKAAVLTGYDRKGRTLEIRDGVIDKPAEWLVSMKKE